MPRLEEEDFKDGEEKIREYAEDGIYTLAQAKEDVESFGAICLSRDGSYLGCVMVPITFGTYFSKRMDFIRS